MKQVIQNFKTGELLVDDVPTPVLRSRGVLVRTGASLISAGTERTVVDFGEKNLLQKAQARPDLVRQVLDKVKREGIFSTLESVRNRLEQPLALGYSSAGTVIEVGAEARGFKPGDRVACAGGGFASHAELMYIPRNLAVRLPDNVSFEAGAFATMGAIGLQGIRQAEAALGQLVAVVGLGLLGQLTVQMLKSAGCRVFGIDTNASRVQQALTYGADAASSVEAAAALAQEFTGGRGFDSVIITAHTDSNEPVVLAGDLARDRGIVAAVGAVGLEIPRKSYYMKEIDFRLSRSYGPGRYDNEYEERGQDYPYGYVRWTEQRNMEAFLHLVSTGKVRVDSLVSHRFPIERGEEAYALITGKSGESFTGVVLTYSQNGVIPDRVEVNKASESPRKAVLTVNLGVLGAGNFANATLLPAMKGISDLELVGIASGSGLTAKSSAKRFGFQYCAAQAEEILSDNVINTVAVLTRHDLHARQVIAALESAKNVFVEKPLALTDEELDEVIVAREKSGAALCVMVGFNRRFAPLIKTLKNRLSGIKEPLMLNYRVNAGFIPLDSWAQDVSQSGGRLIGEGCHFIDLLIHLAAAKPIRIGATALPDGGKYSSDNLHIVIEFENGSLGTVTYTANGDKSFSKESLEVFGGGLAARMDDYRSLQISHNGKQANYRARLRADKGHRAEWQAFVSHLTCKGPVPIPFEEIVLSMRATFAAQRSLQTGTPAIL